MITLDGNYGEGGGQIVRTALALSTLTGKPFEVRDIRKGRPQAGLKAQHLHCIKALKELCNADVEGDELGSEYIKYIPGKTEGKTISVDIGTAGSITLLLQAVLLPAMFADKKVRLRIKGGTDAKWSMPVDYFSNVFLPLIKNYADIEFKMEKRGYYPKGGGKVELKIKPKFSFEGRKDAKPLILDEQKKLVAIKGISHASLELEKASVAERQARAAKLMLNKMNCPLRIDSEYVDALSTGSGITLFALFSATEDFDYEFPIILGSDALGERGKRAEDVGREAAEKLIKEISSGAAVDSHMADNLIPFLGIFGGRIRTSEITNHTKTNIYVVERFLDCKFDIERNTISRLTAQQP